MDAGNIRVKVKLRKEEIYFGPGVAQLLEAVETTGSVKKACASMEMSYNKGWTILNRAEKQLDCELILRKHGGAAGGGGILTEEGTLFLKKYRELEKKIQTYAEKEFEETFQTI